MVIHKVLIKIRWDSVKWGWGILSGPAGEYNIVVNVSKLAGIQISKLMLLFLNRAKCCNPTTLYTKPGK